jgi:uncharacterized protein (DUF2141 family)
MGSISVSGTGFAGPTRAAGNAKLDTFAGIPKEGIGFSRNPRLTFGPPSFASSGFAVESVPVSQMVRMKYFL